MPGASPLAASEGGIGLALASGVVRRRTGLDRDDRDGRLPRFDALRRLLMSWVIVTAKVDTLHDWNCNYAGESFVHSAPSGWQYHWRASLEIDMARGRTGIEHLLRRAGFGASPADLASFDDMSLSGVVDYLLNFEDQPDDVDTKIG